jgi:S-methylmethionine-dependent homocysteine/selenocysteine methylase
MEPLIKAESCINCIHCEQTPSCLQCKSKKANPEGRGKYIYPNSYDDCDCNDFEKK